MKNLNLIAIFFALFMTSSCTKDKEFNELFIYITNELYDGTLELRYGDDNLEPNPAYSLGNILVYTLTPHAAAVELDFNFDYSDTHYSSATSGKISLQASESENLDYTLYPTGDISAPLDIRKLEDPYNDNPVIGNWEKSGGGAYLKFTSSSIYLCNTSTHVEYSGVFYSSENRAVITEEETVITFYAYPEGTDRILIKQYVSDQHLDDIYYYKTTAYSCD